MPKTTILLILALALSGARLYGAQMSEPISYTLRFPAPQTHYVEVEARVPTGGHSTVELTMAVWTPGSYLVREYARTVEAVSAASERGEPLPVEKTEQEPLADRDAESAPGWSCATGSTPGRCRCGPTSWTPASP